MKGIVLAGGSGTRLYPLTKTLSKQLLPIFDKPMIYYPLSIMMLAEIKEILIITTQNDLPLIENLLGDGEALGLKLSYEVQDQPNGIAEAFIIGEDFIGSDPVALILGDNLFYGRGMTDLLIESSKLVTGASIFAYYVKKPGAYGVVEFDCDGKALSIEEKPEVAKSHYAVPGLYFYDNEVVEMAKTIEPSSRGELEITTINNNYLKKGQLNVQQLGRGMTWLDAGTQDDLLEASNYVSTIQKRQGLLLACIEEIAYKKGFIDSQQLYKLAKPIEKTKYGIYLMDIVAEKRGLR